MKPADPIKAILDGLPENAVEQLRRVAELRQVRTFEILGDDREPRIAEARAEWWSALRALGYSSNKIGRLVRRDHSTILDCTNRRTRRASVAPTMPDLFAMVRCEGDWDDLAGLLPPEVA